MSTSDNLELDASQFSRIEAKGLGASARRVLIQERHILPRDVIRVLVLNHTGHVAEINALIAIEVIHQAVIMCREQRAATQIGEKVGDSLCDRCAVIS